MITINLSDKQAANLKFILTSASCDSMEEILTLKEVCAQINNQQFDLDDFESSRQYESLSIESAGFIPKTELSKGKGWIIKKIAQNDGYLNNWDKATKK